MVASSPGRVRGEVEVAVSISSLPTSPTFFERQEFAPQFLCSLPCAALRRLAEQFGAQLFRRPLHTTIAIIAPANIEFSRLATPNHTRQSSPAPAHKKNHVGLDLGCRPRRDRLLRTPPKPRGEGKGRIG